MTIYEQMLSRYAEQDRKANYEVMQQVALAGWSLPRWFL